MESKQNMLFKIVDIEAQLLAEKRIYNSNVMPKGDVLLEGLTPPYERKFLYNLLKIVELKIATCERAGVEVPAKLCAKEDIIQERLEVLRRLTSAKNNHKLEVLK